MAKHTHYSPSLDRFVVCALYHEAQTRGIPTTKLANELVTAGLRDSAGWRQAQRQLTAEAEEQSSG